jgi:transglutaminase-like putative cysteine protease
VGAKSITIRNYVVINSSAYLTSAPTVNSIFVEVYNNDVGYLEDPANGLNLQLTDLHHQNEYEIASLAAQAGDDTSTPYATGQSLVQYIDSEMTYDFVTLDPNYTASDHWIIDNDYKGLCDEYAVLNSAFARALGIPIRTIACDLEEAGQPTIGHQFNEIWDGSSWVHSDGTGAYDYPQVYNNDNKIVNNTFLMYHSDDSLSGVDGPDGDGILHGLLDSVFIYTPGLELIYN